VKRKNANYEVMPFPRFRQPIVDGLRLARRMNAIHALFEADVTDTRRRIREIRRQNKTSLSLTTFVTYCIARVVDENKAIQAYHRGGKLIVHDDVHIAVIIERKFSGQGAPLFPLLIKSANRKSLREIENEIDQAKKKNTDTPMNKTLLNLYWYTPRFLREMLFSIWMKTPAYREKLVGTVGLSAVGMFGKGAGWGIPIPSYTLNITTGTIARKPALVNGEVVNREYLSLTASFDHDVVDGAPATRFTQRLREMIESGEGLE